MPLKKSNVHGLDSILQLFIIPQGIAKNLAKPSTYSESLKSPSGGGGGGAYFNDYMNWREIEEFEELVWKSPAARIAGQLMGSATT